MRVLIREPLAMIIKILEEQIANQILGKHLEVTDLNDTNVLYYHLFIQVLSILLIVLTLKVIEFFHFFFSNALLVMILKGEYKLPHDNSMRKCQLFSTQKYCFINHFLPMLLKFTIGLCFIVTGNKMPLKNDTEDNINYQNHSFFSTALLYLKLISETVRNLV